MRTGAGREPSPSAAAPQGEPPPSAAAPQGEPSPSIAAGQRIPSRVAADAAGAGGRGLGADGVQGGHGGHGARGGRADARGEPFVGRAGKLLDAMLAAIDLARDDVYIANIVKCRPPRNRNPHSDEIAECSGYLRRQIEVVAPRLLVAAGRVAAQALLSTTRPIGQLRGRTYRYGEDRLPVLVTYHPAYLLRSPLEKRKAWADLARVRSMLSDDGANAS